MESACVCDVICVIAAKMKPLYTGTNEVLEIEFWEKEKEQLYCFARQNRTQQVNVSKPCSALRRDSKGFYRFSSETQLPINVSILFSIHR